MLALGTLLQAAAFPVLKVALLSAVGALCGRIGMLDAGGIRTLGNLAVNVFMPALVLTTLGTSLTLQLMINLWPVMFNMFATFCVGLLLAYILVRVLPPPPQFREVIFLATTIGNTGNLPVVLVLSLASDPRLAELLGAGPTAAAEGLTYVITGMCVSNFLYLPLAFGLLKGSGNGDEKMAGGEESSVLMSRLGANDPDAQALTLTVEPEGCTEANTLEYNTARQNAAQPQTRPHSTTGSAATVKESVRLSTKELGHGRVQPSEPIADSRRCSDNCSTLELVIDCWGPTVGSERIRESSALRHSADCAESVRAGYLDMSPHESPSPGDVISEQRRMSMQENKLSQLGGSGSVASKQLPAGPSGGDTLVTVDPGPACLITAIEDRVGEERRTSLQGTGPTARSSLQIPAVEVNQQLMAAERSCTGAMTSHKHECAGGLNPRGTNPAEVLRVANVASDEHVVYGNFSARVGGDRGHLAAAEARRQSPWNVLQCWLQKVPGMRSRLHLPISHGYQPLISPSSSSRQPPTPNAPSTQSPSGYSLCKSASYTELSTSSISHDHADAEAHVVTAGPSSHSPCSGVTRNALMHRVWGGILSWRQRHKEVLTGLTNPANFAVIIGVFIASIPALQHTFFDPTGALALLGDVAGLLGACAIPAFMLSLGANLAKGPGVAKLPARFIAAVAFARLVLSPLIGYSLLAAACAAGLLRNFDRLAIAVMMVVHGVPSALLVHAVAAIMRRGPDAASALLFWQYAAAPLALPPYLALVLITLPLLVPE